MKHIINLLLIYIQLQYHIICYLLILLVCKDFMPKDKVPINKSYHHLQVDDLPIIEVSDKLNFKDLLTACQLKYDKPLKPVHHPTPNVVLLIFIFMIILVAVDNFAVRFVNLILMIIIVIPLAKRIKNASRYNHIILKSVTFTVNLSLTSKHSVRTLLTCLKLILLIFILLLIL